MYTNRRDSLFAGRRNQWQGASSAAAAGNDFSGSKGAHRSVSLLQDTRIRIYDDGCYAAIFESYGLGVSLLSAWMMKATFKHMLLKRAYT